MIQLRQLTVIFICIFALAACGGDKKDAAEREQEAKKAIQEGIKKEKQLYEGMQKAAENMEKKLQEQSPKK
jgi:hypothetical protein